MWSCHLAGVRPRGRSSGGQLGVIALVEALAGLGQHGRPVSGVVLVDPTILLQRHRDIARRHHSAEPDTGDNSAWPRPLVASERPIYPHRFPAPLRARPRALDVALSNDPPSYRHPASRPAL